MRWAWLLGALAAATVSVFEPSTAMAEHAAASTFTTLPSRDAEVSDAEDPEVDTEVSEVEPAPAKKPLTLAEIDAKVAPNEFTNDVVLGRAERITGEGVKGIIAFTFDDGPSPETTPAVLAALKKYDVPASFFVVTRHFGRGLPARRTEAARKLLAQAVADGHLVGSHGHMHEKLQAATTRILDREIDNSVKELAGHAHRTIGMFRPAFGKLNLAARKRLKSLGLTEVLWSIDPRDWEAVAGDEEYMRAEISFAIRNAGGGVILLHDSKVVTARVLTHVLDDLEAWNCRKLARKQTPIYPVSLHYFLRDGATPRPVPPEVARRTAAYQAALPGRCAARETARKIQRKR